MILDTVQENGTINRGMENNGELFLNHTSAIEEATAAAA